MINKSMDVLAWLRRQLEADDNDLLREMVRSFAEELMGAGSRRDMRRPIRASDPGPDEPPQRLSESPVGHKDGQHRPEDPEAASRFILPRLAPGRENPVGAGVHPGRHRSLRSGCLHPPRRRARGDARDHVVVQVPGLGDGCEPR